MKPTESDLEWEAHNLNECDSECRYCEANKEEAEPDRSWFEDRD